MTPVRVWGAIGWNSLVALLLSGCVVVVAKPSAEARVQPEAPIHAKTQLPGPLAPDRADTTARRPLATRVARSRVRILAQLAEMYAASARALGPIPDCAGHREGCARLAAKAAELRALAASALAECRAAAAALPGSGDCSAGTSPRRRVMVIVPVLE